MEYNKNSLLTEDFFDDVESEEIVDTDVDTEEEHKVSIHDFSHYIDFKFDAHLNYMGSRRGLDNMFRKYIYRQFELSRYIKDYCVKYLVADLSLVSYMVGASTIDGVDMYDCVADFPESKYGYNNYLMRVYFNAKDNMGVTSILNLLLFFGKVTKMLENFKQMNFSRFFHIDGSYSFDYSTEEVVSIKNQMWFSKNAKKNIKHFVRVFNSTRKIQAELDTYFDEIDDFRGSKKKIYEFMSFFVNKEEDYKKCSIIVKPNSAPTVVIPENKEVHIHCLDDVPFYIEVRGTLVLHKTIFRGDRYNNNTNKTLFNKFTDFNHRNVRLEISFDDAPYFSSFELSRTRKVSTPTIDFCGVKIQNLDVVADDMFIDDIDELKDNINFINDENIKNKIFEVTEL